MDYQEQIDRLKQLNQRDEEKILKLQAAVRERKAKIDTLKDSELLHGVKLLSSEGIDVNQIIQAIQNKDTDTLFAFMENAATHREEETSDPPADMVKGANYE